MKKNHNESDVVKLVDDVLNEAIQAGASDVHFEPTSDSLVIKFRLDGLLKVVDKLPKCISDNVIARLKVLGHLLTYRTDIPQEGRIRGLKNEDIKLVTVHGAVTDKRLSVFPTIHGQRAVVRLFYENAELLELESLGFVGYIITLLKQIASQNQGVLLLTGPAGSGKSTTLAALLRYILKNSPGKSIVTLEDPVERNIEGTTQIQIPPQGELTFPVALRSLLRQDPEVLMVGEVRDAQTASIVIEAGLTGHLLMTTMHSGNCSGALLRLLEMGIEPYQVTSSISAVLNQRLVRRLCERCKSKNEMMGRYEARGCSECLETGYQGRVLIAEMVQMDGELRKAILQKADMERLQDIIDKRGNMNMVQNGRRLVSAGITTQEEVDNVCGLVNE